jgi:hypothetical protein
MNLKLSNLKVDMGSGAGSRGGKVIGTTSSGKPVYANAKHPSHKSFSPNEHQEAVELHLKAYKGAASNSQEAAHHRNAISEHAVMRDTPISKKKSDSSIYRASNPKPPAIGQALNRKSMKAEQEQDPEKKKRMQEALKAE